MTPPRPRRAGDAGDVLLAALVLVGVAHHLRGQAGLAPTHNAAWGMMAACLPLEATWQELAMTVGHTTEWVLTGLLGRCDFTGWSIRWPHILASIAALALAAFYDRGRRPWQERLLVTAFLLGTPYPLYYGHQGRPYAWLILAGVVLWLTRRRRGWHAGRAAANAVAALSAPFNVPVWGALLVVHALTMARARRRGHAAPQPWRGWALEAALLVAIFAWEAWLLSGYAAIVLDTFNYHLDRYSAFRRDRLVQLLGWRPDPLATAGLVASAALAAVGLLRRPRIAATLAIAGGAFAVGWWWFRAPAMARYFLPAAMAAPWLIHAGLERTGRARLPLLLLVLAGWLDVHVRFAAAVPDVYWNVEFRTPTEQVLEVLRDDDAVVTDSHWRLDTALLRLLRQRRLTVVQINAPADVEHDFYYRDPQLPTLRQLLPRIPAAAWAAPGSRVLAVTDFAEVPFQTLFQNGRRVLALGANSLVRRVEDEIQPAAAQQAAALPLVMYNGDEVPPAARSRLCRGQIGLIPWADADSGSAGLQDALSHAAGPPLGIRCKSAPNP